MNETLIRLISMLQHLPRHPRKISTSELLNRLRNDGYDVTLRSVQRDLNKLSAAFPIVSDEARPQGWSWQKDAPQLDLPGLDPQTALVFKLAESYLSSILPVTTLKQLSPWFEQAEGVLNGLNNSLTKWPEKIRVMPRGQPLLPPAIDPTVQSALSEALLTDKQASVTYQPRDSKKTKEYIINPLALVLRDQVIYLLCTMWEYQDIRQLVMHRVRSAQVIDKTVIRPDDFDLDDYIAKGEFGFPQCGKKIILEADFTPEAITHLRETRLSEDQTITDIDEDTARLRATVNDTWELRWWLLGFGDDVEVVRPVLLRKLFRDISVNMAGYYS